VLARRSELLDINPDDLEEVLREAIRYNRQCR
jgi:CBS-domain-containing membrane protein